MGDEAEPQDVLQQGGDDPGPGRFRLPGGRPSRAAAVLAAAALVIGLAAGYAAGHRQAQGSAAPAPSPSGSGTVVAGTGPAASFSVAASAVLTQDYGECSAQSGHQLELGVMLTNQSPAAVTLRTARAVLPESGLTQVAQRWETCGALPDTLVPDVVVLAPGGSTWLTVTLRVSVSCPAAYPVQFAVRYQTAGRPQTISLPGFSDLGSVPYSGCPAS